MPPVLPTAVLPPANEVPQKTAEQPEIQNMLKRIAMATRIKDQLARETKSCTEAGKEVPLAAFQALIGKNLGNTALETLATGIGKTLNIKKSKGKNASRVDDGLGSQSSDDSTKNLKPVNFQKKKNEFIEALSSMITTSKKTKADPKESKKNAAKAKGDTLKAIAF